MVRPVEPAQVGEFEVAHGHDDSTAAHGAPANASGAAPRVRPVSELEGDRVDVELLTEDLAPGDLREAGRDWSDVRVRRVLDGDDPDFGEAYDRLWAEFGPRGEMEARRVIRERLAWDPAQPLPVPASPPLARAALAYELLVLRRGSAIAAVRDHTAVVRLDARARPLAGPVVVHLSHALVEPAQRGSGLAAWLRALPLQAARRCAAAAGCAPGTPVVLVAEMDPPGPEWPGRLARLRSYERAGFSKLDPEAAPYAQPDFRPPEILAGATPQAVPLGLVLRRVGREAEDAMPAAEVAAVVEAIYSVYAVHVPAAALDGLRASAARWTARQPSFRLLPPTA
jgi:GNAT superfamily N-acetyltransferase